MLIFMPCPIRSVDTKQHIYLVVVVLATTRVVVMATTINGVHNGHGVALVFTLLPCLLLITALMAAAPEVLHSSLSPFALPFAV